MSDRETIETHFRENYPQLKKIVDNVEQSLTSEEYETRITEMTDAELERIAAETQELQQTNTAKAIVNRLRNNTATNDDRNRAILFILRYIRNDL